MVWAYGLWCHTFLVRSTSKKFQSHSLVRILNFHSTFFLSLLFSSYYYDIYRIPVQYLVLVRYIPTTDGCQSQNIKFLG